MTARGIVWAGVQTDRFDEMERFFNAVLGVGPSVVEPGFRLWTLPSGDLVELFAAGRHPDFGAGPVVGFAVADLDTARRSVEAAGGQVVGGYGPNAEGYASLHLQGPDGNVYELVHDPAHAARAM